MQNLLRKCKNYSWATSILSFVLIPCLLKTLVMMALKTLFFISDILGKARIFSPCLLRGLEFKVFIL